MVRVDHIKHCWTVDLWWFDIWQMALFGIQLKVKVWVCLSRFEATCSVDSPFARSADNPNQSQTNAPALPAGLTTVCLCLLISVRSESFFCPSWFISAANAKRKQNPPHLPRFPPNKIYKAFGKLQTPANKVGEATLSSPPLPTGQAERCSLSS